MEPLNEIITNCDASDVSLNIQKKCFFKHNDQQITDSILEDCSNCKLSWHKECRDKYISDFSLNDVSFECLYCYKKQKYEEHKQIQLEKRKAELIKMVMRQTTYTEQQAKEKLEQFNYNFEAVLKDFMSPSKTTKGDEIRQSLNNKTVNQRIYTEFRNMLDSSAKIMEKRREFEKQVNETYEKLQKIKEQQQQQNSS
jgi:hypothetical protein